MGARISYPASNRGFAHLGEFAQAVAAACRPGQRTADDRLRALPTNSNTHMNGGTAGEGYLVPPGFAAEIWELLFEGTGVDLLRLVRPEPSNANAVDLAADETAPWGPYGVQAYWRFEAERMSPTKLLQEPRRLSLHELYAFTLATDEILADAPRLRHRLTRQATTAINWKASTALMNGTGAGQPFGWLNAPGTVVVDPEIGQAASTVNATNVAKMFSRMLPGALHASVWLVHDTVLRELFRMTIGSQPIWLPPNQLAGAPNGSLYGRPVVVSEHCNPLGQKGDIQLVAPALGYYASVRDNESAIQFAESMHLYFDFGISAFRWTFRLAGQPLISAPITPAHGGATKSYFVTLGARV